MYRLTVTSTALDEISKRLGPEIAKQIAVEAARNYSLVLHRALVEKSPVKGQGRTGNLARSWSVKPEGENGNIRVTNVANYSLAVDQGSKAHWIPKKGTPGVDRPVLRWRTGGRGPVSSFAAVARHSTGRAGALAKGNFKFMAKRVWHRATKGQFIVRRAFEATGQIYAQLVNQGAERVIRSLIATPLR